MAENEQKEAAADVMSDKLLRTRSVLLSGEIDKESADKVIRQLLIMDSESSEPIKMFINSPGGDVEAGLAIFDMVRFIASPVVMVGMGLVASAATIVLLAVPAERRLALPNSSYLIHQPMSKMEGVATDIEIYTRQLERLRLRLNSIISGQTGQTLNVVAADTDRDYWMTAEEAKTYGLVTRIIELKTEI